MKNCPFCDELIQDDSLFCRYCGRRFQSSDSRYKEHEGRDISSIPNVILLDILLIGASITIFISRLIPIWPGEVGMIAFSANMGRLLSSWFFLLESLYGILTWIVLLFGLLTIYSLLTKIYFSSFLWMILAAVMIIHPILGIFAAQGIRGEFFWSVALGYFINLLLLILIFLLDLAKVALFRQ